MGSEREKHEEDRAECFFESKQDFLDLLELAEVSARTEWETNFVSDLEDRLVQFGMGMFLSRKQHDRLIAISEQ